MVELRLINQLPPGQFMVDHSRHRYTVCGRRVLGYEFIAKGTDGRISRGVRDTYEAAEASARACCEG